MCSTTSEMMHWVFPQSFMSWKNTVRLSHHQVHLILFNTVILLQKCILATVHINLIYYELCKWSLYHDNFWKLSMAWRDHNITVLSWTYASYKELSEELWLCSCVFWTKTILHFRYFLLIWSHSIEFINFFSWTYHYTSTSQQS